MTGIAAAFGHPGAAAPGEAPRFAVARPSGTGVRPVALLGWAIVLLLAGQLGRLPVLSAQGKDAPILLNEIIIGAVLVATAVVCARARALRLDGISFAALAFAAVGGASAVAGAAEFRLTGFELAYSLAYLARWLAYFGVYVTLLNVARGDDAPRLWRALERTVLAFSLFGIVQAAFLPGFAQLVDPKSGVETMPWDWQGHRLVSTLLDPNFAGAFIFLVLLVQLARLAFGARLALWKPLVLVVALGLTYSRSSVLALLVGGLVIVAARGLSRRWLTLGAAAAVLAVPFLPALVRLGSEYNKFTVTDGSALQRTVMWLRALTVFADHPVFGIGFNTYGFVQRAYGWEVVGRDSFGVDGGLLFIAVMTGLVGLAFYVLMFGLAWRNCRRLWRDVTAPPDARGTALGVAAASLGLVIHGCFTNSLLLPFLMEPLWVLWGLVYLYRRADAPRAEVA